MNIIQILMRLIHTTNNENTYDLKNRKTLEINHKELKCNETDIQLQNTKIEDFNIDYDFIFQKLSSDLTCMTNENSLENIQFNQPFSVYNFIPSRNNEQSDFQPKNFIKNMNSTDYKEKNSNKIDLEEQINAFEKILYEVKRNNAIQSNEKNEVKSEKLKTKGNIVDENLYKSININHQSIDDLEFFVNNYDFLECKNHLKPNISILSQSLNLIKKCIELAEQHKISLNNSNIDLNQVLTILTELKTLVDSQLKLQDLFFDSIKKVISVKELSFINEKIEQPKYDKLKVSNHLQNDQINLFFSNDSNSTVTNCELSDFITNTNTSDTMSIQLNEKVKENLSESKKIYISPSKNCIHQVSDDQTFKDSLNTEKQANPIFKKDNINLNKNKKISEEKIIQSDKKESVKESRKSSCKRRMRKNVFLDKHKSSVLSCSPEKHTNINILYSSLLTREDEDKQNYDSKSDDQTEDEELNNIMNNTDNQTTSFKFHRMRKCIYTHKNADFITLLTNEIDFITLNLVKSPYFENEKQNFPQGFSFSPGWNNFKIFITSKFKYLSTDLELMEICQEYRLQSYFSLILTLVKVNTISKKNQAISIKLCFHLICYHLCTMWNLGKGKNLKKDIKNEDHMFFSNKNYLRLFKTKEYWLCKAKVLHGKVKLKALKELNISESSLKAIHLYNLLLLLPHKNSKTVAFIFYVHHATKHEELDVNLYCIDEKIKNSIINKRIILYKIAQKYYKLTNSAYKNSIK
ncbi:hypothetical protein NUSPORA_01159 [Nucleospora cyclopteri]